MKALSIDPEFAWYIHDGQKTIECRSWKTNYRGEILICASKTPVPGFVSGHAICTAKLTDIEPLTEEHLEGAMLDALPEGKWYAWHLDDVQFVYPFKVRGKQGLFDVDDSPIKYVIDEHTENMTDEEFCKFYEEFYKQYIIPITYIPDQL